MHDELRLRARKLLALALQARSRGSPELARKLTARAVRLLEEAQCIEEMSGPPAEAVAMPASLQLQYRIEPEQAGES